MHIRAWLDVNEAADMAPPLFQAQAAPQTHGFGNQSWSYPNPTQGYALSGLPPASPPPEVGHFNSRDAAGFSPGGFPPSSPQSSYPPAGFPPSSPQSNYPDWAR